MVVALLREREDEVRMFRSGGCSCGHVVRGYRSRHPDARPRRATEHRSTELCTRVMLPVDRVALRLHETFSLGGRDRNTFAMTPDERSRGEEELKTLEATASRRMPPGARARALESVRYTAKPGNLRSHRGIRPILFFVWIMNERERSTEEGDYISSKRRIRSGKGRWKTWRDTFELWFVAFSL